ncbi:type 1 glutamine amidotransferase domain-containing protein [Spongiibacter sp.]|uniref:type 1 glutamine amidotransferase domain-containing protein n=1 Tax=Spongiibacter sp. TaxID=2024860 RepID=UPI00356A51D1
MNILMVLTSHDQLGDSGEKTGFWLEEFAAPYYVFKDAGAQITLASPKGGQPPLDPKSDADDAQTADTERFRNDTEAQQLLATSHKLNDMRERDFDAIFYPGGHGPLWDLVDDPQSVLLIEQFYHAGKPVAAVCHAPAVFRHSIEANGEPLVKGKRITAFSNSEEAAVGLSEIVPFLLEDMLSERGARYEKGEDWASHIVCDGQLLTGQNPASSAALATAVIEQLR